MTHPDGDGAGLRIRFVALALGTIALGLGVHRFGAAFGLVGRDIVGDALWAMMITWWAGALAGQLVLGSGFDPRDLAAYALGVLAAAMLERAVRRRPRADAQRRP